MWFKCLKYDNEQNRADANSLRIVPSKIIQIRIPKRKPSQQALGRLAVGSTELG